MAALATEVPARYAGVCENDVRLAHQCVLIVLEAQIRLSNGLRKEQFILKFPGTLEEEHKDLLLLASTHQAVAGIMFALSASTIVQLSQ